MADEATSTPEGEQSKTASTDTVLTGKESDAAALAAAAGGAGEGEGAAPAAKAGDDAGKEGEASGSLEDYAEFTAPEGIELDTAFIDEAKPLLKELGLSQENAQKLVDLYAQKVQAISQGQVEAFDQLKQDWVAQAKSDKEFGGDKFDESVKTARVALDKFGTPELLKLMDETGVGNHPEIIRFMARVGALTKEDVPGSTGNLPGEKKDRVSILYPTNEG